MIKETFPFLLENGCLESSTLVLKTLNLQSSWITLLLTSHKYRTEAYKKPNKQERLRTDTPKKRKASKECTKGLARCYGHESARNTENGARVEKKHLSEDLCYKREQINYKLHLF
jgi:hypothetical protein